MTEYQQYIEDVFEWARRNKIVKAKYEFADMVKMDRASLSAILNGRFTGKNSAKKVRIWAESVGYPGAAMPDTSAEPYKQKQLTRADALLISEAMHQWDWEKFRRETAKSVLAGFTSAFRQVQGMTMEDYAKQVAKYSVMFADELVKQLKDG